MEGCTGWQVEAWPGGPGPLSGRYSTPPLASVPV